VRATTANISAFTDLGSTAEENAPSSTVLKIVAPGNPARVATTMPNGPSESVAASSVAGCAGWRIDMTIRINGPIRRPRKLLATRSKACSGGQAIRMPIRL
jgi:hypothetical protein